jgi:hypothetical protein
MKKQNKIIVAISPDAGERQQMVRKLAIIHGFARTPSDAGKIVRQSPHDYDLSTAYFVIADSYNFRESPTTTYRLIEMAARGIAVIVGTRRLPKEAEIYCTDYKPEDFI